MNDNDKTTADDKPKSWLKLPWALWVFMGLLITMIVWQQVQINQLATSAPSQHASMPSKNMSPATQFPSKPDLMASSQRASGAAGSDAVNNARKLLEQRARKIKQLKPEITGQRMFKELKFITGDDQTLLAKLSEHLIHEGRLRREIEQRAARGEIQSAQLAAFPTTIDLFC